MLLCPQRSEPFGLIKADDGCNAPAIKIAIESSNAIVIPSQMLRLSEMRGCPARLEQSRQIRDDLLIFHEAGGGEERHCASIGGLRERIGKCRSRIARRFG